MLGREVSMRVFVYPALFVLGCALGVADAAAAPEAPPAERVAKRRPRTRIEFAVTPASVVIFLDGERLGPAAEVGVVETKPGRRVVRLERGEDATEMELVLDRGKKLRFTYEFE